MEKKSIQIAYKIFSNLSELSDLDQILLNHAVSAAKDAYAPYSNFPVGAVVRLYNGELVIGSNQENAAYPSGLCAERVAMFSASANHKDVTMKTLVIYTSSQATLKKQISPCGSCRQVMVEYEVKQKAPIRVLLMNASEEIWEFNSCKDFLPLAFDNSALKI